MITKYVKPAVGRKVRDPETLKHISEDGASVQMSKYWLRRIESGDVEVVEAQKEKKATSKTKEESRGEK
jgi:hypothetical protein